MILKLGMQHRGLYKVCINGDPGLTSTYFMARSNFVTGDFLEMFAACDMKVGRCRQLIEFMKVFEYSRSRSYLDLGPRSFTYEN